MACTHAQQSPAETPGRALDDAALQKYQNATSDSDIGGLRKTVTLGKGEVDLSKWQSSEERAAPEEAADASGEATATPESTSESTSESVEAPAEVETPVTVDPDSLGRVEADSVPLVPSDE